MTDRTTDDKQLKVTDKRMFTPDGELREEYKDLGDATESPSAVSQKSPEHTAPPTAQEPLHPKPADHKPTPKPAGPPREKTLAAEVDYPSGAQFEDLVALLAQTTVTFLQQAGRPQGRSESLEQAQLYLDLLSILEDKTAGNLAPGEMAMLQDALRQLRLAFAQRG